MWLDQTQEERTWRSERHHELDPGPCLMIAVQLK